jgi:hypothetical protein
VIFRASEYSLESEPFVSAAGFDILAITLTLPGENRELNQRHIQKIFANAQKIARTDKLAWRVDEFFLYTNDHTELQMNELYRTVLDEYVQALKTEIPPVGFTFFGWNMPACTIHGTSTVETIKQYFTDPSGLGG